MKALTWSLAVVCALLSHSHVLPAQSAPKTGQTSHQIRVEVALVQTDVMVFDGDNRFVSDLKADQFELRVDGKVQPVSFFDLVSAGTPRDEEIWARMDRRPSSPPAPATSRSNDGRTILFFVDDWHLSVDSMIRARLALQNLIEDSIGVNDQAAIVAASGQLGFLQQFTNDKEVLRAAARKLAGGGTVENPAWPPMNEAHAARIAQGDLDLEEYFVNLMMRLIPDRRQARQEIRARAFSLAHASAEIAARSLSALMDFVRSVSTLPGRKLVFFLSDGFALQSSVSDIVDRLGRLTTAAANAGVVIFTLDTRGLVTGLPDARTTVAPPVRTSYNSVMDFQDGLNALAADTGGRFLKNSNSFETAITAALSEASRYYLLGWYIDPGLLKPGKYWSLRVSIRNRPDLKVRLRAGSVDLSQTVAMARTKPLKRAASPTEAAEQLKHALEAPFASTDLPVSVYAGWIMGSDQRPVLALSYQVDVEAGEEGKPVTATVMGGLADRNGTTLEHFSENLALAEDSARAPSRGTVPLKHSRLIRLEPGGIYQVRVAAREPASGRMGSAWQWISIPSLEPGSMLLSSIFVRNQGGGSGVSLDSDTLGNSRFSVTRRFPAEGRLAFFVNVYNPPAAAVQIRATIYQGNHPVFSGPLQTADSPDAPSAPNHIPVMAGVNPESLTPGSYTLEIAASGQNGAVTQRIPFWIVR